MISDSHTHVMLNAYQMLSNNFNLNFYCASHLKNQLSGPCRYNAKFFKHKEGMIYFYLIFKSFNYDYIYISTGPQNTNRKSGIVVLFFYLIYIFLHGHKTIMGIRENEKYFRGISNNIIDKISNFIRNISISKINLLFFETTTLMNNFKKKFPKIKPLCFVNYALHPTQTSKIKFNYKYKPIKIGILGTLSVERKDYEMVIASINKLKKEQREDITLIMLGKVEEGYQNPIIQKFQKIIKVECKKGFIAQDEFEKLSFSCDFLLSPLKIGFGGAQKGTGSIFDAIATKKYLVIPHHADPELEFNDFCYYYSDCTSLVKILNNIFYVLKNNKLSFASNVFEKYNNQKIMIDLMSKLK